VVVAESATGTARFAVPAIAAECSEPKAAPGWLPDVHMFSQQPLPLPKNSRVSRIGSVSMRPDLWRKLTG
jgi:hypothetical protein